MKQLKKRIARLLGNRTIRDENEHKKEFLLNTKKWNPYYIRHSAITLPEYALKKKVRWSMNSKQGARYIKRSMGNDLKQKIDIQNGIITQEEIEKKPSVLNYPQCNLVDTFGNKYRPSCSYPLTMQAFEEIKAEEEMKLKSISIPLWQEQIVTVYPSEWK